MCFPSTRPSKSLPIPVATLLTMLVCFFSVSASAATNNRLELSVSYTGAGVVDARRPISVLLFDGPNLGGGSSIVGAAHAVNKQAVLLFHNLPDPVFVVAVYDPSGNFTGLSGMIPGSIISIHAADGSPAPAPVSVHADAKLTFEFDDASRLPGELETVVPKAVQNAKEGILEIRKYTLHPGMRDDFIDFFVNKTLAGQRAAGIRVAGQFRSLEDENQFVWIRAFASQEQRIQQLRQFYLGPDWISVQEAASAFIEKTEVILVEPTMASGIR